MSFYTVINCMDGRVQESVNNYLKNKFNVKYIDVITEPGPNKILCDQNPSNIIDSIHKRISISINKHYSNGIAVVGHEDCAGNPVSKKEQINHLKKASEYLQKYYPDHEVISLWADLSGHVTEI